MKKHLFTFTALGLALLCSAFSKPRTAQKQSFEDPQLVWYLVNESGQINPNNPINPSDPMTAGEFQAAYYPLCASGTETDCVRGFYSQTSPSSGNDTGVQQIKKDL
jgi:hypothetical protein